VLLVSARAVVRQPAFSGMSGWVTNDRDLVEVALVVVGRLARARGC